MKHTPNYAANVAPAREAALDGALDAIARDPNINPAFRAAIKPDANPFRLPFKRHTCEWNTNVSLVLDCEDKSVTSPLPHDMARFIVAACNSHAGLVKALESLADSSCMRSFKGDTDPIHAARAALRTAKGSE